MERELEAAIPRENIICRIPMFIGAPVLAKHTDAVATLPLSIATVLAEDLDLQIISRRSSCQRSISSSTGTIGFIATREINGRG